MYQLWTKKAKYHTHKSFTIYVHLKGSQVLKENSYKVHSVLSEQEHQMWTLF